MSAKPVSILLVDDDEDDFILTRDLIQEIPEASFQLTWRADFDSALEEIKQNRHDLYLFDYRLGAKTGLDLLHEAFVAGCVAPIILLTGQGDREIDLKAMEKGAADFLIKGQINSQILERSIRYSLERYKAKEELHKMAQYDELTGLPNRNLFHDRIKSAVDHASRQSSLLGLLFLDLDKFKPINDTYGHGAGDAILKGVSARLSKSIRENDLAARLGGDEFVVILPEVDSSKSVIAVAGRIVENMKPPILFDGMELRVTTSVGVAMYPFDGADVESLVKNADIAMYRAKDEGGSRYVFFSQDTDVREGNLRENIRGLHRAQDRDEFFLEYQPIYIIGSRKPVGLEALLRWNRKDVEQVMLPGSFLPVLEETGLIISVGEWIMSEACRELRRLNMLGVKDLRMAVNFSARQLRQPGVIDMLARISAEQGIEPSMIQIEITEDSLMHHFQENIEIFHRLQEIGMTLSLDDFGTGHSSLSSLKYFPIKRLKIDRSFVSNIGLEKPDEAICKAIISLAHNLLMQVTAEGIETESQFRFLAEAGCDEGQGRLLSPPVGSNSLEKIFTVG
ncbi:MAG: EAL domain-containing protein [Proteobacteria bacterium]|nr:EAL domain-containing protein [Pseudomonadota bacterium]MBU1686650.1 EAL domain-containing protein [Pseudomonadota bacterium]